MDQGVIILMLHNRNAPTHRLSAEK